MSVIDQTGGLTACPQPRTWKPLIVVCDDTLAMEVRLLIEDDDTQEKQLGVSRTIGRDDRRAGDFASALLVANPWA